MFRRRIGHTPLLVILDPKKRQQLLTQAHEELGHRGVYGVFGALRLRFFWPHLFPDVKHHVSSCHLCQIRSTKKTEIPITISSPSTIFTKIYVDVLYMPRAGKYRYIVIARDDLSRAPEGRALRSLKARFMANFFWEEIICRYGAVGEVVTDNGPEVSAAFANLLERYGIPHIRISPYNSKANGVVERGHICHIPYFSLSPFSLLRRFDPTSPTFDPTFPYLVSIPIHPLLLFLPRYYVSLLCFLNSDSTPPHPISVTTLFLFPSLSLPIRPVIIFCLQDIINFLSLRQFSLSPYDYSEYVYNQL